ncbi:MAG: hypothetical protein QM655_01485 [Nocardioidaceae bacterium]
MPTYREISNQVADQWVAAFKSAEEAITTMSENAQRVAAAMPTPPAPVADPFAKLNEVLSEQLPKPSEVVEANFEFTNRLLAAQRDLTLRLLEAGTSTDTKPAAKATKKA